MVKVVFTNKEKEYYVGNLYFDKVGNKEMFSFAYSEEWLSNPIKFNIDPELNMFKGRQFSSSGVFGFINDMIPDRFGKMILDNNEINNAQKENRIPRKLSIFDYLVLVNDVTRMGALRIKDENDNYLDNNSENAVPPYIYLRDIEQASIEFENSGVFDKKEYQRLLMPGSSLGGARPKANIYHNDELWIAKFPSRNDTYDIEMWEKIALDLARLCGINVPDSKLEKYSNLGSTLLVSRFDRKSIERLHYQSFVTALTANDGDSGNYSYINLASHIRSYFDNVNENLLELYKRVIFNYLINNTDNHLRNNGILFTNGKMNLAPFFDVNPTFFIGDFALPLVKDKTLNKESIIEESKYYGLSKQEGERLYESIAKIVFDNLEVVANSYGAKAKEIVALNAIISKRI